MFSYLKFFAVFIINGSTILFSKNGKIERWKRWVMYVVHCYKQVSKQSKNKEIKVKKNVKKITA